MKRFIILIIFCIFSFSTIADNYLAMPCFGCHGPKGNSPGKTIPSLSGLNEEYFIKSFNSYKDDIRENYIMRIIAKGYTKSQIISMAKYFNKQKSNNVK